jgi:CheY-like chemotaxis protein
MARPCFVVVDREFSANISTRKLIIETAKFNVITAYSGTEALETVERFPAVDGVVLDTGLRDVDTDDVVHKLKQRYPHIPIVVICLPDANECPEADHHLNFFDPASLLELLQKLRPKETAAIQAQNESLTREEERPKRPKS